MLRAVLDTNVILRTHVFGVNRKSACHEVLRKWSLRVVEVLYCEDAVLEYAKKLREFGAPYEEVPLEIFHMKYYPEDADDVPFLLCAVNGRASHLISYDHHLTDLAAHYDDEFRICNCNAPAFLADFRKSTKFLFQAGLARQVIDRRGSWYFYTGEATSEIRLGHGVEESAEAIGENAEILHGLEQALNS